MENLKERQEELLKELDEFNEERAKIREMLGKIGGKKYSKIDSLINALFFAVIILLFVLELTTKFLPLLISIEVGVLLISIKIIWMIHSQQKFNHFQFWVLNSIEYRVNDLSRRIRHIEYNLSNNGK